MLRKLIAVTMIASQITIPAAQAAGDAQYIFRYSPKVFTREGEAPQNDAFFALNVAGDTDTLIAQSNEPRLSIALFNSDDRTAYLSEVTWELASGILPPGITEEISSAGTLTFKGVATEAGDYANIVYRVRDRQGNEVLTQPISFLIRNIGDLWLSAVPEEPSAVYAGLGETFSRINAHNLPLNSPIPAEGWKVEGTLPDGVYPEISDNQIVLRGPINVAGNYSVKVTATDELGRSASTDVKFMATIDYRAINTREEIYADTNVDAVSGRTYLLEAFSQNQYGSDVTWTLASGRLPQGVVATRGYTGREMVYSGTPTEAGDFEVVWLLESENGNRLLTDPVRFVVGQTPPMTLASDRGERVSLNTLHERAISVFAVNPFKGVPIGNGNWKLIGDLPRGLRFEQTGSRAYIRGTPSVTGRFKVAVTATDSLGTTDDIEITLNISNGLEMRQSDALNVSLLQASEEINTSATLWDVTEGKAHSDPHTRWEMISGTLPKGITASVNAANSGVTYAGRASETGTFGNIIWRATDLNGSVLETRPLTLTIVAQKAMSLTRSGATRVRTISGMPYEPRYIRVTASNFAPGGVANDRWSVSGVPDGMVLAKSSSDITITGIPKRAGTYQLSVAAVDKAGQRAAGEYALVVENGLSFAHYNPLSETVTQYGDKPRTRLVALNTAANAMHLNGGLVWTQTSGELPPGISLAPAADGSFMGFNGVATAPGTYEDIGFRVTDTEGNTFASKPFTFIVRELDQLALTSEKTDFAMSVGGYVNTYVRANNTASSQKLTAANWAVSGLPNGVKASLSDDGRTMWLTGLLTQKGEYAAGFTVTDSFGRTNSHEMRFVIGAGYEITALNDEGIEKSSQIMESYATPADLRLTIRDIETKAIYTGGATWELEADSLPSGLTAAVSPDGSRLHVSGYTTAAASVVFRYARWNVTLSDGTRLRADLGFLIRTDGISLTRAITATGYVGGTFSRQFTVTNFGHGAPLSTSDVTLSTPLPKGLSLRVDGNIVYVEGRPEEVASTAIEITVTDRFGRTGKSALNLTITPAFSALLNNSSFTFTALTQKTDRTLVYSRNASGGGFRSGLTWTVESGSFPAGLTIEEDPANPGWYLVRGYAETDGTYKVKWRATDPDGAYAISAEQTIIVNPRAVLTVGNGSSVPASVNPDVAASWGPISVTNAARGAPEKTQWTVTGLPEGMNPTVANGVLTIVGTPRSWGVHQVTLTAKDDADGTATFTKAVTVKPPYTVSQTAVSTTALTSRVSTQILSVTDAVRGGAYQGDLVVTLDSGSIPDGLQLVPGTTKNSLRIEGYAKTAGTYRPVFRVAAPDGRYVLSLEATITVAARAALTLSGTTPTSLVPGQTASLGDYTATNLAYGDPITASNWSVTNLPPGFSTSLSNGTLSISGTSTTAGTYNMTVRVVDAAGAIATKSTSIVIKAPFRIVNNNSSFTFNLGVNRSQTVLLFWDDSNRYQTTAKDLKLESGSIPPGTTMAQGTSGNAVGTGILSGTATVSGTYRSRWSVKSAAGEMVYSTEDMVIIVP
ncbi:hypothetical protein G6L37_03300 [Agrobacterium rubi]|nr:hypothetical protein [Agrobacterium rubi]NTF24402.1 hypothetical protein [Agrobacterium rubi]